MAISFTADIMILKKGGVYGSYIQTDIIIANKVIYVQISPKPKMMKSY